MEGPVITDVRVRYVGPVSYLQVRHDYDDDDDDDDDDL
jgi:hypothetical protein